MKSKVVRDRSPEGRFTYLAEKRVGKALSAIRSVANLSDKKNYAYTDDQSRQIIEAICSQVEILTNDFIRSQSEHKNDFKFK